MREGQPRSGKCGAVPKVPRARLRPGKARSALASPHCGAALQGTRWSAEFSVQYEWCLGASPDALAAEREARMRVLRGCTDR